MNRTTRHITCSHSCPLQRTVQWNSNTIEKNTYRSKLCLISNLNSKKLCEIDLFNSVLKTCKVNSVWKWVPARSYTLTEKIARPLWVFWRLQSLNLCQRVTWQGLKTNRSSRLTSTNPKFHNECRLNFRLQFRVIQSLQHCISSLLPRPWYTHFTLHIGDIHYGSSARIIRKRR